MKFRIVLAPAVEEDIASIHDYISSVLFSPVSADRIVGEIERAIRSLETMPERFRLFRRSGKWRGMRVMPVENYNVFYRPDTASHTVVIYRILYFRRNTRLAPN